MFECRNTAALGGCPTEHFPLWEIPINELDRREDPSFDEVRQLPCTPSEHTPPRS